MKKMIPFMTDDEMMELLAEDMNVYFEDYEEIKTAYFKSLENLRTELGNEKYMIIEKLNNAYKSQIASDMVFAYSCGYKQNLFHFRDPVARTFLEVDPTTYTHEEVMLKMPKHYAAAIVISQTYKELEYLDFDTYFMPFLDYFNCYKTIAYKYAHYVGYLDANQILPLTEPGYVEDYVLTSAYHRHIKELIGLNFLEKGLVEENGR